MASVIHIGTKVWGAGTWSAKAACEGATFRPHQQGVVEVIADHADPKTCKRCVKKHGDQVGQGFLVVGGA